MIEEFRGLSASPIFSHYKDILISSEPMKFVEIMGTPYPHGMVIRLVIGDNIYVWNI